jgi:uncharacterized protein (TIGR02145 family)
MKQKILLFPTALLLCINSYAQTGVSINADGRDAAVSAMLDVKSISKGPRMTEEQRNAIGSPEAGLVVWCNNCGANGELQVYNGSEWTNMTGGVASTVPFPCGETFVDARNNKSYSTVEIGTQCWMAQNLNIGEMINSTTGGTNSDGEQTDNSIIEKHCYDNNESNCETFGGLYQWAEMVHYLNGASNIASWDPVPVGYVQGICPEGWHLPNDAEWDALVTHAGNNGFLGTEGTALKSTSGWTGDGNGTDNFGFTGLPAGISDSGAFEWSGEGSLFWSTNEKEPDISWFRMLSYDNEIVYPFAILKSFGISVRCIKD